MSIAPIRMGIVASLVLWAASAAAVPGSEYYNGHEVAARHVLVKFKSGGPAPLASVTATADADRVERLNASGIHRVHSRTLGVSALIRQLSARSDVAYAEPDYIVHATQTPNDPSFSKQWDMLNTGQTVQGVTGTAGADIGVTSAWNTTTGSRSIVVGVIDTGFDYTHPDLAPNAWTAPSSFTVTVGGTSVTCAAGTHGFNAIKGTCDPMDDNDHGSHTSGTIAAAGNNGVGVSGVNQVGSVMGLKFLDSTGSGLTSDAIKAIEFAIQAKSVLGAQANVRVLSNSWGGPDNSQALFDAINSAGSADMLFVVAAGNSSTNNDVSPQYPASYSAPNIIAVAATTARDALSSYSDYGVASVHLGAPGDNIYSTIRGGNYAYFSGTSMATPHVSGSAALVMAACGGLNATAVRTQLLNNTDPVAALAGKTVTGGRLNVGKAVAACAGSSTTPTPTPTAAPTPTPTLAPTPTPTRVPTPTAAPTPTPTRAPTPTRVPTPTAAPTPTPTATPTLAPTPTRVPTPTAAPTPTRVPTPTAAPTTTPTRAPTPTPILDPTPTRVPTPTAGPTPTRVPSPTPVVDPTPTRIPTPTAGPTPTHRPTPTPRHHHRHSPTPAPTPGPSATPTPTAAPTPVRDPLPNAIRSTNDDPHGAWSR